MGLTQTYSHKIDMYISCVELDLYGWSDNDSIANNTINLLNLTSIKPNIILKSECKFNSSSIYKVGSLKIVSIGRLEMGEIFCFGQTVG